MPETAAADLQHTDQFPVSGKQSQLRIFSLSGNGRTSDFAPVESNETLSAPLQASDGPRRRQGRSREQHVEPGGLAVRAGPESAKQSQKAVHRFEGVSDHSRRSADSRGQER